MTIWNPVDDGYADLTSHDTFANGAPHNTFARLRRDDPVHWTDWDHGKGFWSITRHQDITEMNRNFAVFSSAQGIRMEDQSYEEYLARRTFQEIDPPEHMQTRIKLAKAFSKGVIAGFEEDIRALCDEILGVALQSERFDATKTIARELPMRMLGRILGTPDEDLPWPNPELISSWWSKNKGNFKNGTRYLVGKPITDEQCQHVLRYGYQRQRAAAALELAIMNPSTPLFNVCAPGFRQKQLLGLK